jgi:hypothetical protein
MDWLAAVDAYCERTDPGYWSEPVNAVTNLAFLLSAAVMAQRLRPHGRHAVPGAHRAAGWLLVGMLAAIGVGSWLFHTHANRLTGLMDVVPILGFILVYLFLAARDFLGLGRGWAAAVTAGFVPWAAVLAPLFAQLPALRAAAGYAPVALLIALFAVLLWHRAPATARGLALGAGLLALSLVFRSLDLPLCEALPLGTHFMWHLINALMLGWMIEVWRRHVCAAGSARPSLPRADVA